MKISKFFEESIVYNLFLGGMQFIKLFDEVFLVGLIELFLWNLYFFKGRECFVKTVGPVKWVGVGLFELLDKGYVTVLSS